VTTGETVNIDAEGNLTVQTTAPVNDIYIANKGAANLRCGLAAKFTGQPAQPFCAFDLFPQGLVTTQPANAIFVMWATVTYDPDVYMQQSLGPGLFVTFEGSTQRAVTYDSGLGWQAGSAAWAIPVPVLADLVRTLILDPGRNHPVET
jgi:hypothetical protein